MVRKVVWQNHLLAEVADMLAEGKTVKVRIDGESMYPFIRGGKDEVELVPYDASRPLQLWKCVFFEWRGHYMVHRYIGRKDGKYLMMGDGNLAQVEEVGEEAIKGVLQTIFHPNGKRQDCNEKTWLAKGEYWYRLREIRRFLIPLFRLFERIGR